MKYQEALIAWTPHTDKIAVFPWPDKHNRSGGYDFTGGACFSHIRECKNEFQRDMLLFVDFHTAVVRDGIPVESAHKAFLAIDEYRQRIAPDVQGADL